MLLLERDFEVPSAAGKKAFLVDKKASPERLREVLALAAKERDAGYKVSINVMKKNKKFQKEQLNGEGYMEFREFYKNPLKQ